VKSSVSPTVYFAAADGKRYAFNDEATFKTWFTDFRGVQTLSAANIAAMPLGGKVLIKSGSTLVRAKSSPRVYAIAKDGTARWITNPQLVETYFGRYWNTQVTTLDDSAFGDYVVGAPINDTISYSTAMALLR
jgi:hypothetical protein